jgi:hypothetical protein
MTDNSLTITATWSDVDLLEVEFGIRFQAWTGREQAFVTRDELRTFARSLVGVSEGGRSALLEAGQSDLGYATCRVFEYAGPRHLGIEVRIGHAGGQVMNRPDYARDIRLSVPVERGQLSSFASEIHSVIASETGTATLPVPPDWP